MTRSGADEIRPFPLLNGPRILFLALVAAVATSTSYSVQPELDDIAHDLGASLASTSAAAGLPILGYMLGLAFLVPLVDRTPAPRLLFSQLTVLGLSLALVSVAPNVHVFGLGLLVSGMCASAGAQLSTLAGKHSSAERRGRALGIVTAGISAGILLGRIIGGGLADWIGWRAMLAVVAFACLACAAGCLVLAPRAVARAPESYLATLGSMPGLLRTHPVLRAAALSGALWFFAFSVVWMSLSIALALPPLSLPAAVIGLYSLAGLAGMVSTRVAGQLADRFGSRRVILTGLTLAFVCALAMIPGLGSAPFMLVMLALFDAGLFAAQVANQSRVLSLDPIRPARFNSVYMVVYFVGGSVGTAAGGVIVSLFGWPAAAASAAAAIAAAFVMISLTAQGGSEVSLESQTANKGAGC